MDFTSLSDKSGFITFHNPEYKCPNGHRGNIRLAVWANGKSVAECCGLCLGKWLQDKFPIEPVEINK